MYGTIIDAMDDANFWKVPKFLSVAQISPLSLYLFSRMVDHYRYHRDKCRNAEQRQQLDEGWFYWTYIQIQEHVGIREKQARACIEELIEALLIERDTRRTGIEQKCFYRICEEKVQFYLELYRITQNAVLLKTEDATDEIGVPSTQEGGTEQTKQEGNQELTNQELKKQTDISYQQKTADKETSLQCSSLRGTALKGQNVGVTTTKATTLVVSGRKITYQDRLLHWWKNKALEAGCDDIAKDKKQVGRFRKEMKRFYDDGHGVYEETDLRNMIECWFNLPELKPDLQKAIEDRNLVGYFCQMHDVIYRLYMGIADSLLKVKVEGGVTHYFIGGTEISKEYYLKCKKTKEELK